MIVAGTPQVPILEKANNLVIEKLINIIHKIKKYIEDNCYEQNKKISIVFEKACIFLEKKTEKNRLSYRLFVKKN